jgi:Tol biopolymer transport system component
MDEVFWTRDNHIIYSSNRTGDFDLWMCSAGGGESIQITRSRAAEIRGQLSDDRTKLLYYESQRVGNIAVLDLESGKITSITSDDLNRSALSISPDRQRFAFEFRNAYSNPLTAYGIEILHRSGERSRMSLVSDKRTGASTAWSPDGQWIAFVKRPNFIDETPKICIVSPSTPGSLKVIGEVSIDSSGTSIGLYVRWVNEQTVCWFSRMQTWTSSIENPTPQRFYDDSTQAYSMQNGKYVLFRDYRQGREGWWVDMSPSVAKGSGRITRKILPPLSTSIAPNGRFLLYRTSTSELQKVSLPDGKTQGLPYRMQSIYENAGPEGIGAITSDGKEIVYIEYAFSGKLVLVESPFVWK